MLRPAKTTAVTLLLVSTLGLLSQDGDFPVLTGPYVGQAPPGDTPEVFAPGIICRGLLTRDVAMTPDGKELFFSAALGNYTVTTVFTTRLVNGRWSEPEVAPFAADLRYGSIEPCVSPDGAKLLFASNRPMPGAVQKPGGYNIWVCDRTPNGWSEPYAISAPVDSAGDEFFPSLTRDGTIYYTRQEGRTNNIYRSRFVGGKYSEPEKLPPQVNSGRAQFNAFIDPDERYIIVPVNGRVDSKGGTDYYIVFRNQDDTWSEPINMGEKVNTAGALEFSPYVSPDGKYFFFMSTRAPSDLEVSTGRLTYEKFAAYHNQPVNGNPCIYWMSARFIDDLRPGEVR